MRISTNILLLVIALASIVCTSCFKSKRPGIPIEIVNILNHADIHKPDYMKVILSYQSPEDSLKLQAAYFLLKNLQDNYSVLRSIVDSAGNVIVINPHDFNDLKSIIIYRDSIEIIHGELYYNADSIWLDFKNIDGNFLINQIDSSFKIWSLGNTERYNFSTYCNYILPYRVANEEIESSIYHFQTKYGHLSTECNSIMELALVVNNQINNELNYDSRFEINPNHQNIHSTEETHTGNLQDINIYKVKALRSLGIAAVMDYTPYFADSTLGYYSTTVILPELKKLYLSNPDGITNIYKNGKVAKVYRRVFDNNPDCLFSIKDMRVHTPPYLGDFNYIDVSSEYIETSDTTIRTIDTTDFVYVAINNDNKLVAIDWASTDSNGNAKFQNLGIGIRYTPVVLADKEILQVGNSFILGR